MTDKNNTNVGTRQETAREEGTPVLVPFEYKKKEMIVCDMCGHANPEYTALCEMCSNYLKR